MRHIDANKTHGQKVKENYLRMLRAAPHKKHAEHYKHIHLDLTELADEYEFIFISSVRKLDVVWKTCLGRWAIRTNKEKERIQEIHTVSAN